ncbi:Putative auto-transporter adhesin, head GIN domain [Arenibacter nanhaiticus]|uniref:Putative auto-transporter adhesin, head GIN domain n=1 Tax=Arenibacter nanhaiticus TaxID=558155 RepID=A0A1M6GMS3_9FLAO|nr:DUF2807 domain-containing protein [Arenibacter nanhaiticus]SHJ11265.1 Putative auto-transporter adhesin, head GIN domain [Arenibacter nanhaiticus]
MKNFLLLCILCFYCMSYAQRKPKIKGNRVVTEVVESLPAFTALRLEDNLDIVLQKGSSTGYNITADENLIGVLKLEVIADTLAISSFYKITSSKKLNIVIDFVNLNAIALYDGKLEIKDHFTTDHLMVNTYGNSKLELNASAQQVDINMKDRSWGNYNIVSDSLYLFMDDKSDLKLFTSNKSQYITLKNNSKADIGGTVDSCHLQLTESASLKASESQATTVVANVSGTTTAKINAATTIHLSSRDDAKTYIYGDATMTLKDFLGTSELYKRNN